VLTGQIKFVVFILSFINFYNDGNTTTRITQKYGSFALSDQNYEKSQARLTVGG
jgi:hypothetical protein